VATVFVQLNGFCAKPAHEVLWEGKEAAGLAGGWVVDANVLSNKSVVLQFEMLVQDLGALVATLRAAGVVVDDGSEARALALVQGAKGSGEVRGTMQVTLTEGGPDVDSPIPSPLC
jgi:hypothetical protein